MSDEHEPDDEAPSRSDLALYRRAVRDRWPIDPEKRPAIAEQMTKLVEARGAEGIADAGDDDSWAVDNRTRVAAAKVLIEMDRLNMEQEKRDQQIPDRVVHEHRFAELSDDELIRRAAGLFAGADPPGP